MRTTIRVRLTLWYAFVLSSVLALSAGAFYWIHSRARLAQFDAELARSGTLVARLVPPELDEGAELAEAAGEALEDIEMPSRTLAVFDGGGRLLAGAWGDLPHSIEGISDAGRAVTVETAAGPIRTRLARYRHENTTFHVGVAEPLLSLQRELADLRRALLASVLFALLLAVVGGSWIARAALRPLASMAVQARGITARTPGARLAPRHPGDELGVLAGAFNELLGRLEAALAQQRQFMADASHELRTPVSVARTTIEVTLGVSGRPEPEYRDCLAVVAEQARRLTRLVEDMFTLARADAAGLCLERRLLYLDEVVASCVKESAMLATSKGVSLEWNGPSDLEMIGDEQRIGQLLVNLLDNALRHTPSGGRVHVAMVARAGVAELAVTDGGSGIPEAEHERIFERFVRLDASRPSAEGAGLGLPIARAIAEAHGGTLSLARSDASGSTFLARLPLRPA